MSDSDDDFMGPSLPATEPPKKRRRRVDESIGHDYMLMNAFYRFSYANESAVTVLAKTPDETVVVSGHKNGMVKFWNRLADQEELVCVKQYIAHPNKEVAQLLVNSTGSTLVTVAKDDSSIKVFDMAALDMVLVIKLEFVPNTDTSTSNAWFKLDNVEQLVVHDTNKPFFVDVDNDEVVLAMPVHKFAVQTVAFNPTYRCFISSDTRGIIELWTRDGAHPPQLDYKLKSETDLMDVVRAKSRVLCLTVSSNGEVFATFSSPDNLIRLYTVATGKLHKKLDESLAVYEAKPAIDGRLLNNERVGANTQAVERSVLFDNNDKVLVYSCAGGIKAINIANNSVVTTLGYEDLAHLALRFNKVLVLNKVKVSTFDMAMLASNNALVEKQLLRKPMVIASAYNSKKMFVFNHHEQDDAARDIDLTKPATTTTNRLTTNYTQVVLHTTSGDIKIKFYSKFAPKAVDNFVKLCQKKYYNNVIFHRVIKEFMIQTGDPLGDGTGGESAWGGHFEDEFNHLLNHVKPYMVSMANAGPNTNGSQFFITTAPASHLDNKHTIFGEVILGFDTVRGIEACETDTDDKPLEQIAILSTTLEEQ